MVTTKEIGIPKHQTTLRRLMEISYLSPSVQIPAPLRSRGFSGVQYHPCKMNRETATIRIVNKRKAATEHPRIFLGQPKYCLRHPFDNSQFEGPAHLTSDGPIEQEYLRWLRREWHAKDGIVRYELERLMDLYDTGVLEIAWSSRVHKLQAKILVYALTQMRDMYILGRIKIKSA